MKKAKCIIIAVFISFFLCNLNAQNDNKNCQILTPEECHIKMKFMDDYVIIDLRYYDDYKKKRIPGAVNAEKTTTLYSIMDTVNHSQDVFVYCEDLEKSKTLCNLMVNEGFQNLYIIKGGLKAWRKEGYDIDK